MKPINIDDIEQLPGRRAAEDAPFPFRCYPGIGCFNRCCRNLNLYLYPYDVARLRRALDISSARFLDQYVDVVLKPDNHFPEVLLRMAENDEKTCPFVTDAGCAVYADRPDSCRSFPLEGGLVCDARNQELERIYFYRPPDFCLGQQEETLWTPESWMSDQDAIRYQEMTALWARIKAMFHRSASGDPWQGEGPGGRRARMAFMAAYNPDPFRAFLFDSSFRKRYKIKKPIEQKIRRSDAELFRLACEWITFFLWGVRPTRFRPKGK